MRTGIQQAAVLAKLVFDEARWTWWHTQPNTPTEDEIAQTFRELADKAVTESRDSLETGRLLVTCDEEGRCSYWVKVGG